MRPHYLLSCLVLAACGDRSSATTSATSGPTSASVTKHVPAVGDKATYDSAQTVVFVEQLRVHGRKGSTETKTVLHAALSEECLAVVEQRCVRSKLVFGPCEETKTFRSSFNLDESSPPPAVTTAPFSGRTFVLEGAGAEQTLKLEDGTSVPKELADKATLQRLQLVESTALVSALPDTLRVGDSVDELSDAFGKRRSEQKQSRRATTRFEVRSVRGEPGREVVTLAVDHTEENPATAVNMKGTLDLRADGGVLVDFQINGPITLTKNEPGANEVTGTMTEKITSTYSW